MIFGRDHKKARQRMVEQQLRGRNITDERVLEAMAKVPRHLFVPDHLKNSAYTDGPLPIGEGQTISQPYIVAYMTQLLDLDEQEVALEIGTGSGYQAAVLAHLVKKLYSVERIPELAEKADERLRKIGIDNVEVVVKDGSEGLPEHAPYAGILVTAAAPQAPDPLKQQLAESGKLIVPVGSRGGQVLERWTRHGDEFQSDQLSPVAFVPLLGDHGWDK